MNQTYLRLVFGGLGLAILAACGGGNARGIGENIGRLGATFQQAFAQGPNDVPIDIANADLVLSLTEDPFEL
ncbi:hypothetical protein [Tateyamaria sp. syn59]|uniref:hypothetical protein n=1 Tax=Tateyamaria sp. syn59 TaxID=2576942 RepID=UPI0011BD4740|nr:hypothetical protein [Tateyamaria sp. syn59]